MSYTFDNVYDMMFFHASKQAEATYVNDPA